MKMTKLICVVALSLLSFLALAEQNPFSVEIENENAYFNPEIYTPSLKEHMSHSTLFCTSENPWYHSSADDIVISLELKTQLVDVETHYGEESYHQQIHVVTEGTYEYGPRNESAQNKGAFECSFKEQIDQKVNSSACRLKNYETKLLEIKISKTFGIMGVLAGKAEPLVFNCSVAGVEKP
jgi:hypothetical protein